MDRTPHAVVLFTPTTPGDVTYVIDCACHAHALGYMKEHHPEVFATHDRRHSYGTVEQSALSEPVLRIHAGKR